MDHCRLAPPPLEDAIAGIPAEELRLLIAPPEPVVAVEGGDIRKDVPEFRETILVKGAEDEAIVSDEAAPLEQQDKTLTDDGDHIHDDEEAERVAAAAREVS